MYQNVIPRQWLVWLIPPHIGVLLIRLRTHVVIRGLLGGERGAHVNLTRVRGNIEDPPPLVLEGSGRE